MRLAWLIPRPDESGSDVLRRTQVLCSPSRWWARTTGVGEDRLAPGVKGRALLAWALGVAVPIRGLIPVALSTLIDEDFSRDELAIVVLSVGGLGLAVGLYLSMLSARAVADPLNSLLEPASEPESERWRLDGTVTLRGRSAQTRLAEPVLDD
jgi:hypothetical protein